MLGLRNSALNNTDSDQSMAQENLIASVFREEILSLSAYKVTDAHGLIKLDAMENPYTWPPAITEKWLRVLADCHLNRYPDAEAQNLTTALHEYDDIPNNCAVLLGNGSDEIIQLLLMALPANATILSPDPGFVMYRHIAHILGLNFVGIPLLEDSFELDQPAMLRAVHKHQPAIIFLAYPNNPTGNLYSKESILQILDLAPGLVILDEAYAPFANASFIDELTNHERLLVMRTVSKLGLAGLRLGYLAGQKAIIEQLNKIRLPYNINTLTQISGEFCLTNIAMFNAQTQQICRERTSVFNQLNALVDITAYSSAANFILFRCPANKATIIFNALRDQGVLVKNTSPQGGLLTDCLRVTIGTPEENHAFISALKISLCISQP